MKILVCIKQLPQNTLDGYNLRVYHLVKALTMKHSIRVVVKDIREEVNVWLRDGIDNIKIVNKVEDAESIGVDYPFKSIEKPFLRFLGYDHKYYNLIRRCNYKYEPDAIMAFGIHYLPYLFDSLKALTICDVIDSPTKTTQFGFHSTQKLAYSLKTIFTLLWLYYRVAVKCNILLAVTNEDATSIRKYSSHRNVYTLSNGVDSNHFTPYNEGPVPIVLFSGNMDFSPNINAVKFFVSKIWKKVLKESPFAHFVIVGRNPVCSVKELALSYKNVSVLGFVDDIREYIGRAWVVVAPMIDGTGIKNKILEAWSMGKPVVASKLATHGLSARDNKNILISDDPHQFAKNVERLLADRTLRMEIGNDARRHVIRNFSWVSRADQLTELATKYSFQRTPQFE